MSEKRIEVEFDKQANPWKWVALILIGLLLLDLSCFTGVLLGGLAGFAMGRKTTGPAQVLPQYDFPMMPEIPGMPEHPRVPMNPIPPEEPNFDMPWIPELGERPRLGVTFITRDEGAEIVDVAPGSPAEKAGLQVGDVVTKVNGQDVSRLRPLNELILMHQPGDFITLTVLRDSRTKQMEVQLAAETLGN